MTAIGRTMPLHLEAEPRSRWRRARSSIGWNGAVVIEVIVIILIWEFAISGLGLWNPKFVPPPSDIAGSFANMVGTGALWRNFTYSAGNFVIGYLAAAVFGVIFGFALGTLRPVRWVFGPFLWLAFATPRVAIQPILVLWMGFGSAPKVLIIFLMAFFPIVITIMEGVQGTDPSLLRAARVFGAGRLQTYRQVILPASLPYVLTGLRLGIARALVGIVVGEFIGGTAGLGFAIKRAGEDFHVDTALAVTFVLVVLATVSMTVLVGVKRRLAPWDEEVSPRLR